MNRSVEISFDCLPLRSLPRLDIPLDAPPALRALAERLRKAILAHGTHNAYYLHKAKCTYYLTNDPAIGTLAFGFEGTVLTGDDDSKAVGSDLEVTLLGETCDWLTQPVVAWFQETVNRAVLVEFDRFIAAGDLKRTVDRLARLQAQSDAHGGFLGMGL